jgi:hypothetical protein
MITKAWRLLTVREHLWLLCLLCNRWNGDPNNVAARYCAYCRVPLAQVPDEWCCPLDGRILPRAALPSLPVPLKG